MTKYNIESFKTLAFYPEYINCVGGIKHNFSVLLCCCHALQFRICLSYCFDSSVTDEAEADKMRIRLTH